MAREKMGGVMQDWQNSKRIACSYLRQHYLSGCGNKLALLYTVEPDWLTQEKQQQLAAVACEQQQEQPVKFLSSNDVLTAEIFKLCDVDFGSMMVNLRSRLQGISSDLVGNYCEPLGFFREDISKGPVAIRKALEGAKPKDLQPSPLQSLGMRFGTITSWVPFHHDLELEGCQLCEHFPVFDPMGVPKNTAVIYSPRKGCLALMLVAGLKTHEAFKHHAGFQEQLPSQVLETTPSCVQEITK
jgi:hypothetical protein